MAGGRLTIDLDALAANYRRLAALSAPAETAAVVKADAYGLGIEHAVPALAAAGCRTFFVAYPAEGLAARAAAPDARVFVLSGPMSERSAGVIAEAGLIPVLKSVDDIALWRRVSGGRAALHVDTGMNRLGVSESEAAVFAAENAGGETIPLVLVMSHLACADNSGHPLNRQQLESFQRVEALFEGIDSSLANSAGIMLGGDYRCALTRAGIALYGGRASNAGDNPMRPVVTAETRVLQVRRVSAGGAVGYGAAAKVERDSIVAIAATGYADGYHRAASGTGVPLRETIARGACGFAAGQRVPVVGRVSMDLTAFDVTDCAKSVAPGDWIELFGPNIPVDEVAEAAGTIGYELLTGLGRRYERVYVGGSGA
ncbi:MAG: alanine racemase [Brucellaceae bacterium]|nr:alanine racemase [Brucellaceae bacterium]